MLTSRERFRAVFEDFSALDRLPVIEWAPWWDQTTARWGAGTNGIPAGGKELQEYFGLDKFVSVGIHPSGAMPPPAYHGAPLITTADEYREAKRVLYGDDAIRSCVDAADALKREHESGDVIIWFVLEGFFWYPRTLFGIEPHLLAFYDEPELMHEMNADALEYYLRAIDAILPVLRPDIMTFAEDMSYNLGPMIGEAAFDEFMLPYYKKLVPELRRSGTLVFIDTDGQAEPMIPWFKRAGIQGVLPLERQAGVDVNRIKERHPDFYILGGYDKMVMWRGEDAIRAEFERIMPAMRAGGYVPSVDHQTPPQVSLEDYRIYLKLLNEYARKAVEAH